MYYNALGQTVVSFQFNRHNLIADNPVNRRQQINVSVYKVKLRKVILLYILTIMIPGNCL